MQQSHRHLWIGGGTCSGKSTLARAITAATGRALMSLDDSFNQHASALPGSTLARVSAMSVCERLAQTLETQTNDVWAIADERWPLVRASLAVDAMGAVIEGEAVLPSSLAALGVPADFAVFLVVSPATRRERYAGRQWARELVAGCANPDVAFEAWMRRDDLVQERIASEAAVYGFPVVDVSDPDRLAAAQTLLTRPVTP